MLLKLFLFLFLFPSVVMAQNTKPLIVTDNSTATCNTTRMVVSSGTLSCSGSVATITTGGGGSGGYVTAPSNSCSTCTTGQYSADSSYIYICQATNTWLRTSISTWGSCGGGLQFLGNDILFLGNQLTFI